MALQHRLVLDAEAGRKGDAARHGAGNLEQALFEAVDSRQAAVERQGVGHRVAVVAGAGRAPVRKVAPALGAPEAPRPVEDFVGIRDPFVETRR